MFMTVVTVVVCMPQLDSGGASIGHCPHPCSPQRRDLYTILESTDFRLKNMIQLCSQGAVVDESASETRELAGTSTCDSWKLT